MLNVFKSVLKHGRLKYINPMALQWKLKFHLIKYGFSYKAMGK
jgi:hypothetical protein